MVHCSMKYFEFDKIAIEQPHKMLPESIIRDIAQEIGQQPAPDGYFISKQRKYVIHSTRSIYQIFTPVVLVVLWFVLVLVGMELYAGRSVVDLFQSQDLKIIKYLVLFITLLVFMASFILAFYVCETHYDPDTQSLFIRRGIPFLSRFRKLERLSLKSILLKNEPRVPEGFIPYWNWAIELQDGREERITSKMFSQQSTKEFSNDYWANLCYLPERAWVLSRMLDVPLHLVANDLDIQVTNENDISKFTQDDINHILEQSKVNRRKAGIFEIKLRLIIAAMVVIPILLLLLFGILK